MEDFNARMGALSLHTSSTDSLLARVARLPVDVLELIYKHLCETSCSNVLGLERLSAIICCI
jgi:hypothetical protein